MKAKDLAALLLKHPEQEVCIQYQRLLTPVAQCVTYIAAQVGDEYWIKVPPDHIQTKCKEKGIEIKPSEVFALTLWIDRQFEGERRS